MAYNKEISLISENTVFSGGVVGSPSRSAPAHR